jgi:hypothetical protein
MPWHRLAVVCLTRGFSHNEAQRMRAEPWAEFWQTLGLVLRRFDDVGLLAFATDLALWSGCQARDLILITDNRNLDSEDALEATIFDSERTPSHPALPQDPIMA